MPEPSVLIRLADAMNSHDPDQMAAVFTEDYDAQMRMHPEQSFVGNAHVRQNWTAMFEQVPDLSAQLLRSAVQDEWIWSEWELTGNSPVGETVLIRGTVLATERDGRIASTRFYLDRVTPPPERLGQSYAAERRGAVL